MKPFLGCIADDVTGATDLAINLVQGGMRVIQWLTVPTASEIAAHSCDAVVVALKTRSCDVQHAVDESLRALSVLRDAGCKRYFFKYCSTFDSTDRGNIGPVTEALARSLSCDGVVYCPAFPRNGRTLYQGYLFVEGRLLHESSMATHPLTPMRDPNIVNVLRRQTHGQVGLVDYAAVDSGFEAVRTRMNELTASGVSNLLTDCCDEHHLATLAKACWDEVLVTGGSAICGYLPSAWSENRLWQEQQHEAISAGATGRSLILSGSCSNATNRQVAVAQPSCESWQIDIDRLMDGEQAYRTQLVAWAAQCDPSRPILVFSTADASSVALVQKKFGTERVARAVETFLGAVARELVADAGVTRLIVAGGETAGAVVSALGIDALRIGSQICPGVPWTEPVGRSELALALKSGNFGGENFFMDALRMRA